MKNFYLLLFFVLAFSPNSFTQPILQLLPNDTIQWDVNATDRHNTGNFMARIINRSSLSQTYYWIKEVYCSADQWEFPIEDGFIHSPPEWDSSLVDITINPGEQLPLKVGVFTNEQSGWAQVNIKVYLRNNPETAIVTGVYIFNAGCQPVNVKSVPLNYQIKIFPNPTQNTLNIKLPTPLSRNTKVLIFNTLGHVAQKETILTQESNIDVSQLKSGIYFLKINMDEKEVIKRFVISR